MAGKWQEGPSWEERTAKRQSDRYEKAVRQGRLPRRRDRNLSRQAAAFQEAVKRQTSVAARARTVLMQHGVPTIQAVSYYNFARHLDGLSRRMGRPAFELAAQAAVEQWTAKGLRREVLEEIRAGLFGAGVLPAGGR